MRSRAQGLASLAAGVVVLVAAAWSWRHAAAPPIPQEPVGPIVATYAALLPHVADQSRIGFIATAADTPAAFQAAQYAIAPRILDPTLHQVLVAVTAPGAPPTADEPARQAGFTLVSVQGGGVRVYRRR